MFKGTTSILHSSREAWPDAEIELFLAWFLHRGHRIGSSADFFFFFFNVGVTCHVKHVIALIQTETSFRDSTQTNHKG